MSLDDYGWTASLEAALEERNEGNSTIREPGRVLAVARGSFRLMTAAGERDGAVSGRLRHTLPAEEFPAVGDWVAVRPASDGDPVVIDDILPRRTAIVRKAAGETTAAQVVAANLDTVFYVTSMNQEFRPRRIERYLAVIWESGARPVVLLSKADACPDPDEYEARAGDVALGVPVHVTSGVTGEGVEDLAGYLAPGSTICLLGSSGVGKSTLLNRLAGEDLQTVYEVREADARGRHTTTSRELFRLPGGALVIDTPGLRELALWGESESVSDVFPEIEALTGGCRFKDCGHGHEPGCAVRAAVEDGTLDEGRLMSYRKLIRELAHVRRKRDVRARLEDKRRWMQIQKDYRARKKTQWGRG